MPVDEMLATPAIHDRDMPFVSFKTETIEDVKKTKETDRMCFKDQDYAVITPPGGKANNIERIDTFFQKMESDWKAGRVKREWIDTWRANYALYQKGQEIPLDGTPIKGWKLLPGSVQEELIRLHVLTVEALANLTDEGARNVGMGAAEWKRRAQAWLAQNESHESGALKLTTLTRENESLKGQVETLAEQVKELEKALSKKK